MIVLGIDPGYAIVGCGVVQYVGNKFSVLFHHAIITTAEMEFSDRINKIYNDLNLIIDRFKPEAVAVEKLFFNSNQKTAIDVAQARGVMLLSARQNNIQLAEYTPLQVKQSVVGYGRAQKQQVMEMTRTILNLKELPKPDDVADALALAICHAHNSGSAINKANLQKYEIR